ncbi:hypothetical protein PV749_36340 [Streptomyces sp. ID03-2B]|uniref:hypothetical protein n=1 Tax=Streptomyces TaxID=1883 RepID=UPI0029A8DBC6|nr:hypothetical protein [Streptomyces sp. ID03-2B]MDX3596605.1 hypothetical protein [Streptomyces sp. ID03-2B]WTC68768.1 hypothetical protein OG865_40240 [Streptomyces anulatus]
MSIDRTAANRAGREPGRSGRGRGSGNALNWCEFVFKVLCVGSGLTLFFAGFPLVGLGLLGVLGVQVTINRN